MEPNLITIREILGKNTYLPNEECHDNATIYVKCKLLNVFETFSCLVKSEFTFPQKFAPKYIFENRHENCPQHPVKKCPKIVFKINPKNQLLLSGIPYAVPPIGDLRFTFPQKVAQNGQKYYVGNNDSNPFTDSICSQMDFHEVVTGQEDCLHLHVYVPETGKGSYRFNLIWQGEGNTF